MEGAFAVLPITAYYFDRQLLSRSIGFFFLVTFFNMAPNK